MSERSGAGGRRLGLRHLEHFIAVVETGSITGASARLFVASSGVSQTIAELEAVLGQTLFERGRTGSRATGAGLALIGPARRAVEAFADATSAPGEPGIVAAPHLSVLSTPSLVQEPTATVLGALHHTCGRVRVTLTEPSSSLVSDAVQPVLSGLVDVAITELPETQLAGARVIRMPDQDYRLVCPPGTPRPVDSTFRVADLLGIGLVVAPLFESSDVYRRLQAIEPEIDRAIVVRTEHRDAFMLLARAGAGAVLLDRERAERAERLGCVVGELEGLPPRRIAAVARAGRATAVLQEFLELCRGPAGSAKAKI